MSDELLTPDELKGITDKVHMAKVQEQFDHVRKEQEEKRALHRPSFRAISIQRSGPGSTRR
jgi:hypothetical protein